jgi:cystathionine beta-lyase/cystathionine gamma-synthase
MSREDQPRHKNREERMSREDQPHPATLCARGPLPTASASSPLAPPIGVSAVYCIEGLDQVDAIYRGEEEGFIYGRDGHPNRHQLAAKLAQLEGGEDALITASGMAAISSVLLTLLGSGDHVALSEDLYGRTSTLVIRELSRFGIEYSFFDPTTPASLAEILRTETRVVLTETLSNPLVRLADLDGLAEVSNRAGVPLIVDHTFAPLLCRPLERGAAVVIHSLTKLIGGHSDITLGAAIGARDLIARVSAVASTFGLTGPPFDSWLALRGLATLEVRSSRITATALEIAHRLEAHPKIARLHYPGLPSHPDWKRAQRDLDGGFGSILTADLGDRARADRFIRALRHIPFAPSLGDVQTTLSHPATTSHRGQPDDRLARLGITPGLVRFSIGLEHPNDLWVDLSRALEAV